MVRRNKVMVAVTGLALIVSACGPNRISYVETEGTYSPSFVRYAITDGRLQMVVRGAAFDAAAARRLVDQVRVPQWFQPVELTTALVPGPRQDFRLVALFDPQRPVSTHTLCGDLKRIAIGPPQAESTIFLAFCAGDSKISGARLDRIDQRSPDRRNVAAALNNALLLMLPSRHPEDEGDCETPFC